MTASSILVLASDSSRLAQIGANGANGETKAHDRERDAVANNLGARLRKEVPTEVARLAQTEYEADQPDSSAHRYSPLPCDDISASDATAKTVSRQPSRSSHRYESGLSTSVISLICCSASLNCSTSVIRPRSERLHRNRPHAHRGMHCRGAAFRQ